MSNTLEYQLKLLTGDVQNTLSKTQSAIDKIKANIKLTVSGGKEGGSQAVQEINDSAKNLTFGESIKANLIAGFAVDLIKNSLSSIGDFLTNQLEGAKGLESTRTALNGILGDTAQAGKLLSDVVQFAAATPFEIPELASTAKQLAAAGFTSKEVLVSLKKLGDVASGSGTPLAQIAYVYAQIKTANKGYSQDLNQLQNAGIPIYKNLAETLGKSTDEIKEMASKGKVSFKMVDDEISKLTSSTGIFNGAMEKQSKTLGGLLSTVSDNIGGIGRKILGLTDTGEAIPNGLFEKLRDNTSAFIQLLESDTAAIFFTGVGTNIGIALDFVNKLKTELSTVVNVLATGNITYGIFGFAEDGAVFTFLFRVRDEFFELKTFLEGINFKPLGESFLKLAGSVGLVVEAIAKSNVSKEILNILVIAFNALAIAGKFIAESGLPAIWTTIANALAEVGKNQAFVDALILSLTIILAVFAGFAFVGFIIATITAAIATVTAAIAGVIAVFNPVTLFIIGLGAIIGILYFIIVNNLSSVQSFISGAIAFIGGIVGIIMNIFGMIGGIIQAWIDFSILILTTFFELFVALFLQSPDKAIESMRKFITGIGEILGNLSSKFTETFNGVGKIVSEAFDNLTKLDFGSIGITLIKSLAKGMLGSFGFLLDGLRQGMRKALDIAGLGAIPIPFADGGLVKGRNVLALLNDGGGDEFIMNANATRDYQPLLERMNNGRFNQSSINNSQDNRQNNQNTTINNYSPQYDRNKQSKYLIGLNT